MPGEYSRQGSMNRHWSATGPLGPPDPPLVRQVRFVSRRQIPYSRYCTNGRHLNVEQLECLPSLDQSEFLTRPVNQSESRRTVKEFKKDPRRILDDFLHSDFDEVCLFDFDTSPELENIFENHDWVKNRKIFHSHFSDQGQWIYCYQPSHKT